MMLCFSVLSFQLFLSLIFSCPCVSLFCVQLFVVCLLFCICFSLFFLSFSLSLGKRMKTKPVLFFLQRALNISVLHFLSFYVLPLFFPGSFDVSVDSLSFRLDELTNADARGLACARAQITYAHTLGLASFYTGDQRHPYARVHSSLFVSLFHVLLHPH